jgi:hypothetical protein
MAPPRRPPKPKKPKGIDFTKVPGYGPPPKGTFVPKFDLTQPTANTLEEAFQQGILSPKGLENLFAPGQIGVTIPGAGRSLTPADIEADWEYQSALADINPLDLIDEGKAASDIGTLATQFGGDLSGLVAAGLISQETADAAKANQFSTMANLGRELQTGTSKGVYGLAARGILNSGGLPALAAQLNQGYQQATTQGSQQLQAQIGDIRSGVTRAKAERRLGLGTLKGQIAQRLSQQPQYQVTPEMKATWNPKLNAYVDPWGRKFGVNQQFLGYV